MTIPELYSLFKQFPSVVTDTRKLKQGDLYFALKGPNFNGNTFALQALAAGAAYSVVDEEVGGDGEKIIRVNDVLDTLQQLAKYHREQFTIPFIGITGSNGKTTSKELVYAVLSSHFTTYTTQGNLNNHIGVPLTLLSVKPDAEMAVIEMGANHQREIAGYCLYARPTHGIVTNAGKAHLEGFGGVEGVRKGKGELFDFLAANDGTAFIYADYDYLATMSKSVNHIVKYGQHEGLVQGSILSNEPFLQVSVTAGLSVTSIHTQLVGDYNLPNILCAAAVGAYFGVPDEKIKSAIENYTPSNSRSQLVKKGSNSFIMDAYNANPSSMKVAIENFAGLKGDNKLLVLGGMMELGNESVAEHGALIDLIKKYTWKDVIVVGGDFGKIAHPFRYFSTSADAKDWLDAQHFQDAQFLVKGSRSMQMEKILG